ncbi:MAG: PAS-domain containing protein [Sneathiella sp.]
MNNTLDIIDALENISEAYVIYDENGLLVSCNQNFRKLYNYSETDVAPGVHFKALGRLDVDRGNVVVGDDQGGRADYLERKAAYREKLEGSFIVQLKDGRWIKTTDRKTSSGGIISIQSDITDRKRMENELSRTSALLHAAFHSNNSICAITEPDTGTFIDVNEAWLRSLGYERGEVIGYTAGELNVWGNSENRKNIIKKIAEAKHLEGVEGWQQTKDGRRRDYIMNADILTIEGKDHLFFSGTDITERNQMEETIRRTHKMEAVDQLIGGIAHDFNNILGIIQGNLELLEEEIPENVTALDQISRAQKGVTRGTDITKKLLGFSRKKAKKVSLTQVNSFVGNLEDLIATSLTASIQVETHLADDLWSVSIDPGELEDAILNLSINARDAMPGGGMLIIETENKVMEAEEAALHQLKQAGDYVIISVSDTGIGMTEEVKSKALEPFFTTKGPGKGTGLGLSMVYGFAQRSGGYLNIYTEEGKGTKISLLLPRAKQKANPVTRVEKKTSALPTGTETVLIVDDEEQLRDIATAYLQDLGYVTLMAKDGDAALEVVRNRPDIQLLFSDVVMPGILDGYQLAKAVQTERPEINILLTSGFTKAREEILSGKDSTARDLVTNLLGKPYSKAELAESVRKTIDRNI